MKKSKKLPISTFELVWYILTGLVALWGLTYIVIGMVGMYSPVSNADNVIALADKDFAKTFGLGFFGWGLIILSIGAVAAAIVLIACSKTADRESEKAARRAARLSGVRQEQPVVDAEIKPIEK